MPDMKSNNRRKPCSGRASLIGTALLLAFSVTADAVTVNRAESAGEQIETGRRIYQQGILPDGSPLRALRPEGFVLEGTYAACVTCHRRSGMGTVEGSIDKTILVPPVAGSVLFEPARFHGSFLDSRHHYVPNAAWDRALTRPGYDQASLGRALRDGLDPGGKALIAPMPRYDLDDEALVALTAYMRQLSTEPAPGTGEGMLHLATILTPDAPEDHARSVAGVVKAWSDASPAAASEWRLHVWELSGPADEWQDQLQAHYRQQPVFAVLSGAGGAEWSPVHRFCEQNRLPCVFPSIEVEPERGGDDFYSVYFSPGVSLEARILARHLRDSDENPGDASPVVQVFSDASGRSAAETLSSYLQQEDRPSTRRRFRFTAPASVLDSVSDDGVLILWLRPSELAQLVEATPVGRIPKRVYLSSLLAPPEAVALPSGWKERVTYVSLFDDLGLQGEIARIRLAQWLERNGLPVRPDLRVEADAYAASYLFSSAIGEIRDQELRRPTVPLNREHLLETLETLVNKYSDGTRLVDPDSHVAYYGRMSLGPRQRMAVRGGVLLRYASADSNKLVAVGDRIVH